MDYDVVVIGSINMDLIASVARHPQPGETVLGSASSESPGGKGANQAVAAALRGARTAIVGAVGTDAASDVALTRLTEAGVDLSRVVRVPGATGLAIITVSHDGENSIVVIPNANAAVGASQVDAARPTWGSSAIVVLQAELAVSTVEYATGAAARAGARVVLNAAPATALSLDALRVADPLVVNEHEGSIVLAAATGRPAPHDPEAIVQGLIGLGIPSVIITLGSAGSLGADAEGTWTVPARDVEPLDTTGAGDAFVGAMAAALAAGASLREAAELGTRVAAFSVQRLGAQPSYPTLDEELP